jgi:hypothetical protein
VEDVHVEARRMTAGDLRRLAEAVDGVRDVPAYVVWGTDGPVVTQDRPHADEVVFECMTNNSVPQRTRLRSITLEPALVTSDGKPVPDIAVRFDAAFWSEAAVEKFVLPYYTRMATVSEAVRMRKAFNHTSVAAMLHMPDSTSRMLTSIRRSGALEALTLLEFEASL